MKYLSLNDGLYKYLCASRSHAAEPILQALRQETASLGEMSRMQISEEQGTFMSVLVAAIGAKRAIEVGTFTGYSSLCIARALPAGGRLICIDASEEWTAIARKYWEKANVQERIELRLGQAIPLLQQLRSDVSFDFAFIDAEKTEYDADVIVIQGTLLVAVHTHSGVAETAIVSLPPAAATDTLVGNTAVSHVATFAT